MVAAECQFVFVFFAVFFFSSLWSLIIKLFGCFLFFLSFYFIFRMVADCQVVFFQSIWSLIVKFLFRLPSQDGR